MIQREWKPCTIYSLTSDTDPYGQKRVFYNSTEEREIFIKPYREYQSNNPIYLETQYVALIKGDISTNQIIQIEDIYYRIIDVIHAPKYNQLFLKETKERPAGQNVIAAVDPAEWGTVSGAGYYTPGTSVRLTASYQDNLYYIDRWSTGARRDSITVVATNEIVTYTVYLKNYVALYTWPIEQVTGTNIRMSVRQGTVVSDMTAVPLEGQVFSHWSDGSTANPHEPITLGSENVWFQAYFDTIPTVQTPYNLAFQQTEYNYQFSWDSDVPASNRLFIMEMRNNNDTSHTWTYPSSNITFVIPIATQSFDAGSYSFRVQCRKDNVYSDWSDWLNIEIT